MTKRDDRIKEGRHARLRAEVNLALKGEPVVFSCIYRPVHHIKQYKLGWDSVSDIDIKIAIGRATGAIPSKHSSIHLQQGKLSCQS